jgi:hypothetical protein
MFAVEYLVPLPVLTNLVKVLVHQMASQNREFDYFGGYAHIVHWHRRGHYTMSDSNLLIGTDVLDRPTCSLQDAEWGHCIRGAR